jgi:hypothetical protein
MDMIVKLKLLQTNYSLIHCRFNMPMTMTHAAVPAVALPTPKDLQACDIQQGVIHMHGLQDQTAVTNIKQIASEEPLSSSQGSPEHSTALLCQI